MKEIKTDLELINGGYGGVDYDSSGADSVASGLGEMGGPFCRDGMSLVHGLEHYVITRTFINGLEKVAIDSGESFC